MKESEYDKLSTNKKNKIVAEKVMGIKLCPECGGIPDMQEPGKEHQAFCCTVILSYHTNFNVMDIINRMIELDFSLTLFYQQETKNYYIWFYKSGEEKNMGVPKDNSIIGEEIAPIVCKAALLALGEIVPD